MTDLGSYVAWNSKSSSYSLSRGWGGEGTALFGLNEYTIIVLWFSASCTRCLFGPGLGWSKLGVRKSRLSAKFEFRYGSSKDTKTPGGLILGTLLGPSYAINLS